MEKRLVSAFFHVSIDYLFDNLESGKRNYCLGKTFGKSLWIQESVRALYIVSSFVNSVKYDVVITHEFLNRLTVLMADPFVHRNLLAAAEPTFNCL